MKAKRIWIATHKDEPYNRDVSFTDPMDSAIILHSDFTDGDTDYAEYKEYLLIEIDTE